MIENRKAVRVEADGICEITDNENGIVTSGFLKDLSISGVGFFSYEKYDINQHVEMIFSVDGDSINLQGSIVFTGYKDENLSRYGVEIEEIDNECYEKLNKYVTREIKILWGEKMRKYSIYKPPIV